MQQMDGQYKVEGLGLRRKITGTAASVEVNRTPEHHQSFEHSRKPSYGNVPLYFPIMLSLCSSHIIQRAKLLFELPN